MSDSTLKTLMHPKDYGVRDHTDTLMKKRMEFMDRDVSLEGSLLSSSLGPGVSSLGSESPLMGGERKRSEEWLDRGRHQAAVHSVSLAAKHLMPQSTWENTRHGQFGSVAGSLPPSNAPSRTGSDAFSRTSSAAFSRTSSAAEEGGGGGKRISPGARKNKKDRPGTRFTIARKKGLSGRSWSWWDSSDGVHGGRQLRIQSNHLDNEAIRAFDLFPQGPRAGCTLVLTDGKTTMDVPYTTFAPCNADDEGPAGFIVTGSDTFQFPIDAAYLLPSFEKQLERMRAEAEFVHEKEEQIQLEQVAKDAAQRAQTRAQMSAKVQQEAVLKRMLTNARGESAPFKLGPKGQHPMEEYAEWRLIQAGGVPPPPQKHPLVNLHHYFKEVQISGPNRRENENELSQEERDALEAERHVITAFVRTLEVWNRTFTMRYNLTLRVTNAFTGEDVDPDLVNEELLVWTHTRIFKHPRGNIYDPRQRKDQNTRASMFYSRVGKLFMFGGKSKGGQYKNYLGDFWGFDYATNVWSMFEMVKGHVHVPDREEGESRRGITMGRIPGPRSSACTVLMGNKYFVAGGMSGSGKLTGVSRLDFTNMHWVELTPVGKGDKNTTTIETEDLNGDYPPRGFCTKNLVLKNQVYAPLLSENAIYELCLHSLTWRKITALGLMCWETTKLLCMEDGPMVRFVAVDFNVANKGKDVSINDTNLFPAIETGIVWRSFTKVDEFDVRDNHSMAWQLTQGQTANFKTIPSTGDSPGYWTSHGITKGLVRGDELKNGAPTRCSYYVFGGCRVGGTPRKSSDIDVNREFIIGIDIKPRIGLPVVLREGHGPAPLTANSRATTASSQGWRKRTNSADSASSDVKLPSISKAASFKSSRPGTTRSGAGGEGHLRRGVIIWVEEGQMEKDKKKLQVKVLWDDEEDEEESRAMAAHAAAKARNNTAYEDLEAEFMSTFKPGTGSTEQAEAEKKNEKEKALSRQKYDVGYGGRFNLALWIDREEYKMAEHICNDLFELDIVESIQQAGLVKKINEWKMDNGDVSANALKGLVNADIQQTAKDRARNKGRRRMVNLA